MVKKNDPTSNKWGVLSLITSIIGFLFIAGIFLGFIAIFFGYLGLKNDRKKLYARIGIILGIICVILGIIWLIIALIFFI